MSKQIERDLKSVIQRIQDRTYEKETIDLAISRYNNEEVYAKLTDAYFEELTQAITNSKKKYNVIISGHFITNCKEIPNNIEELDISNNPLTVTSIINISNSSINALKLGSCIQEKNHNPYEIESILHSYKKTTCNVKSLNLTGCMIPDQLIAEFIQDNVITEQLYLSYISDVAFKSIAQNSKIKNLTIYDSYLTTKAIEHIQGNNTIQQLIVDGSNIDNKSVPILINHHSIKKLILINSDISYEGAEKLVIHGKYEHLIIQSDKAQEEHSASKWCQLNFLFKELRKINLENDKSTDEINTLPIVEPSQTEIQNVMSGETEDW